MEEESLNKTNLKNDVKLTHFCYRHRIRRMSDSEISELQINTNSQVNSFKDRGIRLV